MRNSWNNKKCFDTVDVRCKHEDDIQIFDKFKSLDIFDDTFSVTSHAQILGIVPFEKLVVSDIAQNIVRNLWKVCGC